MNENLEAAGTGSRPHVDWASILAGAAIAAGASVVFTGFTAAIGLGSVSAEPGEGLGTFALILVGLFAFASMVAVYGLVDTCRGGCAVAPIPVRTKRMHVTASMA